MMKILLLILISCWSCQTGLAQTNSSVRKISGEVTAIDKHLAQYRRKAANIEGISLEGTRATYYTSGTDFRKIHAAMFGETFRAEADFYYQNDKLIFAYERLSRYNRSLGAANLRVVKIEERRFYFADAKLIKFLTGKKPLPIESDEARTGEDEITDLSGRLRQKFSEP